jgi:hypothetical protein
MPTVFPKSPKCVIDSQRKEFISVEQQRVLQGNNSPGPVYLPTNNTISSRAVSQRRTDPRVSTFGSSSRLQLGAKERAWLEVPGPGSYDSTERGRSNPAYGFGTSQRRQWRKVSQPQPPSRPLRRLTSSAEDGCAGRPAQDQGTCDSDRAARGPVACRCCLRV